MTSDEQIGRTRAGLPSEPYGRNAVSVVWRPCASRRTGAEGEDVLAADPGRATRPEALSTHPRAVGQQEAAVPMALPCDRTTRFCLAHEA